MNSAFLKSYQTLSQIYTDRAFSSIALNKTLMFCSAKDKSLITKIVYGVLDNDVKLEYIISKFVKKMPQNNVLLFLKIGAYCLQNLSIPAYAVVNDVAELSKLSEDKHIVGFVNATLKRIANEGDSFSDYPDDKIQRLSIEYSYPEWALKKLVRDYGLDVAEQIVSYPPDERTTVRLVGESEKTFCERTGCETEPSVFDDAFYVSGKLPPLDEHFTVQSLSSMAIARICSHTDNFLDCCSAPGGKAVYVKQLTPSAKVTACDVHKHRVDLIDSYAGRMHTEIETHCMDMTQYCGQFDSAFDTVLCDVPCSGFGVLNNRPDIKLFRQSKDISDLMKLQYAILSNCSRYVKRGGRLVYSTCTVFDNENGQNIRKFLKENPDFFYGVINLPEFPQVNGKPYYQFLPHKDGVQGFFAAVLQRTE